MDMSIQSDCVGDVIQNTRLVANLLHQRKHIQAARIVREREVDCSSVKALLEEHMPNHAVSYYLKDLAIGLSVIDGEL